MRVPLYFLDENEISSACCLYGPIFAVDLFGDASSLAEASSTQVPIAGVCPGCGNIVFVDLQNLTTWWQEFGKASE